MIKYILFFILFFNNLYSQDSVICIDKNVLIKTINNIRYQDEIILLKENIIISQDTLILFLKNHIKNDSLIIYNKDNIIKEKENLEIILLENNKILFKKNEELENPPFYNSKYGFFTYGTLITLILIIL